MTTDTNVSLLAEIPEDLHERVQDFLTANPSWHYDDFVTAAIASLLMSLGDSASTNDARLHLDRMFRLWGKAA